MGEFFTLWLVRFTLWLMLGSMAYVLFAITRFAWADFRMGLQKKETKQCVLAASLLLSIVLFLYLMLLMTFANFGGIVITGIAVVVCLWWVRQRCSLY